jgi:hypothetical protein
MTDRAYADEEIAVHLDEARFMPREPIKRFIALDDSARASIAIIEQLRRERHACDGPASVWSEHLEHCALHLEIARLRAELDIVQTLLAGAKSGIPDSNAGISRDEETR